MAPAPGNPATEFVMKESIRKKLEQLAERREEVSRLLAEPAVTGQMDRFRELSVEYARLEPVAGAFQEWVKLEEQLAATREMARDPDPGVRELALAEIERVPRGPGGSRG